MRSRWLGRIALVSFLGAACAGDGTGLEAVGGGNAGPTLLADVQPILTVNCAVSGCHAGNDPQQGQNLSTGRTFSNVVNVASNQLPTMDRVEPGQPDSSYLVHKIQGTHLTQVPGSGVQMPQGRSPLSQTQIDLIRSWISAGARRN